MKNFLIPVVVAVAAITSAFTTNHAEKQAAKAAIVPGHMQLSSDLKNCDEIEDCSTINTGTFCRVGQVASGARLWDYNANDECVVPLYRP